VARKIYDRIRVSLRDCLSFISKAWMDQFHNAYRILYIGFPIYQELNGPIEGTQWIAITAKISFLVSAHEDLLLIA
jgi:hypothetical protein